MRDSLLCDPPPPPPPTSRPLAPPSAFAHDPRAPCAARTNAARLGCHTLMDPIGFGFEHDDAAGLWRDTEAGKQIDATGEITHTSDAGRRVRRHARASFQAQQERLKFSLRGQTGFRFGYGRGESDLDQCTLGDSAPPSRRDGGDFGDLLIELTQTDAFLYRSNEVAKIPSIESPSGTDGARGGIAAGTYLRSMRRSPLGGTSCEDDCTREARRLLTHPTAPNAEVKAGNLADFWPPQLGTSFVLGKEVAPLEPLRKQLLLVSGVNGPSMEQDDSTVNPSAAGHGDLHSVGM